MTVGEALDFGRGALREAGVSSATLDAALLLMRAAALSRTELATKHCQILTSIQRNMYEEMLAQRAALRPVQYILGECEFMGLTFAVDERVLIPRPDTEILAEAVIAWASSLEGPRVLDLGTGSGALAVAVAHYVENSGVTAVDICGDALEVARDNALKDGCARRICFLRGDLFDAVPAGQVFDIIMSNPPYISDGEVLPLSVAGYEPPGALFGGARGLDFYERIVSGAQEFLTPITGKLFLEIGFGQAAAVLRMLDNEGYADVTVLPDLAGIERVISAALPDL